MHHYLYDKSDIILSKTDGFTVFNKASWKWCQQLFWHIWVCSAGHTYFSENHFKAMFSFHWISILL